MKGRVLWWNNKNGYGFVEYNKDENAFVHLKNNGKVKETLTENQEIEFTLEQVNNETYISILRPQEN